MIVGLKKNVTVVINYDMRVNHQNYVLSSETSNTGQKGAVQQSEGGQRTARGESSEGAGNRWLKMAIVKEIGLKSKTVNCLLFTLSQLLRKPAPAVDKKFKGKH